MATKVKFAMPEREIENTGVTFRRIVDGKLHGDLTIRQNHLEWRPSGKERVHRVLWKNFAKYAEDTKSIRPKATSVKSKKKRNPSRSET